MFNRLTLIAAIALGVTIVVPPVYAQDKSIIVASTTSTQDSGLFEYLLPSNKRPESP
jgi:tungstate transport system substrate-binding protein